MKRATKLGRPPKARPQPVLPIAEPSPDAESGHNLFLQLERMAALIAAIDERTKRLEAAVVPPSTWDRIKGTVGM